jgi:superfamily II DNA helicase RecQ
VYLGDKTQLTDAQKTLLGTPLRVNAHHKLLVCIECGTAIGPARWLDHLKKEHQAAFQIVQSVRESVERGLQQADVLEHDRWRDIQLANGQLIQGIKFTEGHQCICGMVSSSVSAMRNHSHNKTANQGAAPVWTKCAVQRLGRNISNLGGRLPPRPSQPASASAAAASTQASIMMEIDVVYPAVTAGKVRSTDLPPLVRALGWEEVVNEERPAAVLASFVRLQTVADQDAEYETEQRILNAAVELYETTTNAIRRRDGLLVQMVQIMSHGAFAGKESRDEDERQKFSLLQDSSRSKYSRNLGRLLVFVFRAHHMLLPNDDVLAERCVRLRRDPSVDTVRQVLDHVFRVRHDDDGQHASAVVWYLRCLLWEADGSLAEASLVIHAGVQLKHAIRLSVLGLLARGVLPASEEYHAALQKVQYPCDAPSAFADMVPVLAILKQYEDGILAEPQLEFVPNGKHDTLRIVASNRIITLEQLQNVVAHLQTVVRVALQQLLCGIQVDKGLMRQVFENETGATGPDATCIPNRGSELLQAMRSSTKAREWFVDERMTGLLCAEVMREGAFIVERLLLLVHLVSGMPARVTELGKLLFRSPAGASRSVFASRDTIKLVQTSSKMDWHHQVKVVRFLDPTTALLLVAYLAYVRPVEVAILRQRQVPEETRVEAATALFVLHGERMTDQQLRDSINSTLAEEGLPLTVRVLRHVMIGFGRHQLDSSLLRPGELERFREQQSAHSAQTGFGEYARELGQIADYDVEEGYYAISRGWWVVLRLVKMPGRPRARPALDLDHGEHADSDGGHVAALVTAPESAPAPALQVERIVIVTPFARPGKTMAMLCREPLLFSAVEVREPTHADVQKIAQALGRLHGHHHLPNDAMQQALVADQQRVSFVLVSPTGSGKSDIVLASILQDERASVSVVICPLKPLLGQWLQKAKDANVTAELFNPGFSANTSNAQLVVLQAEHCLLPGTYEVLHQMSRQHLRRIVLDELHLFLDTNRMFRPHLRQIHSLMRAFGVPVHGITATMPPAMVADLFSEVGSSFLLYRESSMRPSLSITVVSGSGIRSCQRNTTNALHDWRQQHQRQDQAGTRHLAMVFVLSVNDVASVAQMLRGNGIESFEWTSAMLDGQKEAMTADWLKSSFGVMVATTGFGAGMDFAAVDLVVHFGGAYGLVNLAQEGGRAGRRGQPADHVVCVNVDPEYYAGNERVQEVVRWALEKATCRVSRLCSLVDGEEVRWCVFQPDRAACDVCRDLARNIARSSGTRALSGYASRLSGPIVFDELFRLECAEMPRLLKLGFATRMPKATPATRVKLGSRVVCCFAVEI